MHKWLATLLIFASACTASTVVTDSSGVSPSPSPSQSPVPTSTTAPSGPDLIPDSAVAFVATLDEVVIDTVFSGAVIDSPQVFIAAGEIMCGRLNAGDSVDEILTDYLNGFSNSDSEIAEEDVIVLAGGVLGASVELFCPQHIGALEDTS
jgi:hypothetical protein